jgi:glycosyltransferase involved in cell wall biosynthesis
VASFEISVIMCVRNGQKFIAQALDSVAAQELAPVETLIVDDGSTDNTAEIACSHELRPTLIRQEARGLAAALNTGIASISRGLVCFLDHDDVWPADRLRLLYETFCCDHPVDAVFGQIVNTDEYLNPVSDPVRARLLTTMLIQSKVLRKIGAFRTDVSHGANVDWISRAEHAGLRSSFRDRVVLWRRIHGSNSGVRDRQTARSDMLRIIRDHHARTRKS